MYTQKNIAVLSIVFLLSSFAFAGHRSLFQVMEEMDKHMEQMRQEMHTIFSSVTQEHQKDFQQAYPLHISEENGALVITVQVKTDADTFDAKTKGAHTLLVSIPQDRRKITVSTKGRMVSVESSSHVQQEQPDVEAEKQANSYHFSSFDSSSMSHLLKHPIDVTQASLEFEQGKLSIAIPYVKPEEKTIAVKIKKPEQTSVETVK